MIDTSSWKDFVISKLFEITSPASRKMSTYTEGNIPYVSSGAFNNGIVAYLTPKIGETLEKGNCITVSPLDGTSFFQENDFLGRGGAGSAISILRNDNLTELTALFICAIIKKTAYRYGYNDALTSDNLKKLVIKLPSQNNEQPDWDYMESYMKQVMEESEKSLEALRRVNNTKHPIDTSKWGEFKVGNLFDKLNLKCRKNNFNKALDCSEEQTDEFSLPLTNAKHFNNGIQFYGRPDEWDSAEMTIDIVSNGAIATGDVYAQPQRTGVLWDSYLIKCKYDITSELVLQYMACVIQRCIKQYFGWDDKCIWDKVKEQYIKLPITSDGEPDWKYMEDYMKKIMDKAENTIKTLTISYSSFAFRF